MNHAGSTDESDSDPYDRLLAISLEPKWTDTQLERHIWEAVRYGVRMERERILSATKDLTYPP